MVQAARIQLDKTDQICSQRLRIEQQHPSIRDTSPPFGIAVRTEGSDQMLSTTE
jgi:hypothetical protein